MRAYAKVAMVSLRLRMLENTIRNNKPYICDIDIASLSYLLEIVRFLTRDQSRACAHNYYFY